MPAYVLSSAVAVARSSNAGPALTTPLRTGSPTARSTSSGSPVSTDSSSTAGRPRPAVDRHHLTRVRPPAGRPPRPPRAGPSPPRRPDPAARGPRRVLQQGAQVAGGPPLGGGLQGPPGGQHDRDQRPGEVLPDRQRADEGDNGEQVDPGAAPAQRGDHPRQGGHHREQRADDPAPVGEPVGAEELREQPGEEGAKRDDQQPRLQPPPPPLAPQPPRGSDLGHVPPRTVGAPVPGDHPPPRGPGAAPGRVTSGPRARFLSNRRAPRRDRRRSCCFVPSADVPPCAA